VVVLNYAPRHEDDLWSGGKASRILKIGTRWMCVISFKLKPLYPRVHWLRDWVGLIASLDVVMRKIPVHAGDRTQVVQPIVTVLADIPVLDLA
jgi:hypothetical protein